MVAGCSLAAVDVGQAQPIRVDPVEAPIQSHLEALRYAPPPLLPFGSASGCILGFSQHSDYMETSYHTWFSFSRTFKRNGVSICVRGIVALVSHALTLLQAIGVLPADLGIIPFAAGITSWF